MSIDDIRDGDAAYKRKRRAEASLITIPRCANSLLRLSLEEDDAEWLMHYFGPGCGIADPFTYKFTSQQREMISAIRQAIKFGGDQALAASRGEGKTTLVERLLLKCALTGEVNYSVLFGASGGLADNSIETIRHALSENVRLLADYPEVCVPVVALEGIPQRAKSQKAKGFRHDNGQEFEMAELSYSWCGQEIVFPNTPGSPSAGAIIAARGLDAAVRGLKKRGKRPMIAVIDDPDTEDSARSVEQAGKLEKRIDAAIGGLGGQGRSIGRVMITTIQSRISASFRFTDPMQKPTFKGRRYRYLVKPPRRMDLWEEYITLRKDDLQRRDEAGKDVDPFGRRSHEFYLSNFEEMNSGAEVSNPNRFDPTVLADGSQTEVSALQHYYNEVAKLGPDVVATEYDNDPPEETAIVESGLSAYRVQRQLNGFQRGIAPDDCTVITQGIDVRKVALHWVVRAWRPDGTGHVIDYGVHEVIGTKFNSEEGVDAAITRAVLARIEETRQAEYHNHDGRLLPVDLTLVDAGWQTDAIYSACLTAGAGVMPVMGFGKSSGCTQASFRDVMEKTDDRKPGDHWFLSKKKYGIWLVCADADYWKGWEHSRWLTAPEQAGALMMYGVRSDNPDRLSEDEKGHHSYARHICNESEVEEPFKGGVRRVWKSKSANTHWLDASYYCDVAANIRGVRIATASASKVPLPEPRRRLTADEIRKRREASR